ncbi:methyltransferase family protein [Undibacterium sp. TJN25]|uniref:methyltransferase family protein n=1 Tax=Undibacterium sp. TJN25 TaxID=3413056 RepID=UPI003BF03C82
MTILLKFVFVPFIINAAIGHLGQVNYRIVDVFKYYALEAVQRPYFIADMSVLWLQIATAIIYCIDVVPFVVGYLTESYLQDNKIKSVDITASGWFFCLMCYPPFNGAAGSFIPTNVPDHVASFAKMIDAPLIGVYLHIVLNVIALLFLLAYASCSVSLGWKCSNLTSRGVVRSGLYGIVRHPAYVCKNAAWWIFAGSVAVHEAAAGRPWVFNLVCLAVFTCVYAMRAITEERHMRYTDDDYAVYCSKVPYRFIPNII